MHDTELCAHESGCNELARSRDMCHKHYERGRYTGALPPKFRRARAEAHSLFEHTEGSSFCVGCNTRVRPIRLAGGKRSCPSRHRKYWLKSNYNLTQEQYDARLIELGNRCAICSRAPGKKGLSVDHLHGTVSHRDLICQFCNVSIGMVGEDPEILRAIARYIESHSKDKV